MSRRLPGSVELPDLSGLDSHLTANLMLSMTLGRAFPPSDAQHLVTAFVRTTEGALRRYEDARKQLERLAAEAILTGYLRGLDDLELTFIALHRAMRVAEALMRSSETKVGKDQLPSYAHRQRLRKMRNAIEHHDAPIIAGRAGKGHTLALFVRERDSTIDDEEGTHTVRHVELGGWVRQLHALAVELTNHPEGWSRLAAP